MWRRSFKLRSLWPSASPSQSPSQSPAGEQAGFPCMPGELPLLGHVPRLHIDAVAALRDAQRVCGPVFWVNLGLGQRFLFCTGEGAFELLKDPRLGTQGSRDGIHYLVGDSVIAQDGPTHRRMRSALNPPFSPRGLAETAAGACIAEAVSERAERFLRQPRVALHAELQELALDLVLRIAGVPSHELPAFRAQYREALLGLLPLPWDFPLSPRWRARRAVAWLDAALRRQLQQARTQPQASGVLPALLATRDEAGQPLPESELIDNIRTLFLAGHETTATVTAWAVIHLAQDAGLWQRLLQEAAAGAAVPRSPTEARQFPFAEALFRESVRLYGPAWFLTRRTTAPLPHAGYTLPAGCLVALAPSLWARDATLYPEPERFLPERFLQRPPPTALELSQFGGGPHFCLGYHLAWLEVVAFLVALGRTAAREQPARLPQLDRPPPLVPRYFPTPHPPAVHLSFVPPTAR